MKKKDVKNSLANYKKRLLLNSKINESLFSFTKTRYSSKKYINKTSYPLINNYHNKSFNKCITPHNISTHRNLSFNNMITNSFLIEPDTQNSNPLYSMYKTRYFPKSLKNKEYIREIYNSLPSLKLVNDNKIYNETYNNSKINNTDNMIQNSKDLKDILLTQYKNSVNDFNDIYKNNGEELVTDIKTKEAYKEPISDIVKNNKINMNESIYITSVIKSGRKNYSVEFEDENYYSPKNSLMTLKINNQLINNIKDSAIKCLYNSYAEKINENQKNKLKLLIMPKLNIRLTKFHFENINHQQKLDDSPNHSKKSSFIKKFNSFLSNSKIKKNKENTKNDIITEYNDNNLDENEKITIDSLNMRNSLITEIKNYYCKYLKRNINIPCSRIGATFIKYKNKLYLFGGAISSGKNELWTLEIKTKGPIWKRINYKTDQNINYNLRYGHSCVYLNGNFYIFGGNINLKKLRNIYEDILIYNIKSNHLKSATFQRDQKSLTSTDIYTPPRRNHIAHVIGTNMIVHGGIDISKEYSKENAIFAPNPEEIRITEPVIKNNETFVLNDWMLLDLHNLKWTKMTNIQYKIKDNKKAKKGISRVYHSSCLILSYENIIKGTKINIYKNSKNMKYDVIQKEKDNEYENIAYDIEKEGKYKFDINYEGIYIFGGLDENLKETDNLFILHCFRNPLVFFEPEIGGKPPEKRYMASMYFHKNLNILTIFGGKDLFKIYNDLYILDIMNFEWIKIELFGPENIQARTGHCSGIINDTLFIFGGCDENNKYPLSKTLSIELDLLKNKKIYKIYDNAKTSLKNNPKDTDGKYIMKLLKEGNEIPKNIFLFSSIKA